MTKNKTRDQTKRKQKAALRSQQRDAAKKRIQKKGAAAPKVIQVTQEQFSDESYLFWLAHGINHILSDYKEGLWTPLFPDIYESGKTPEPEQIAKTLLAKYEGVENWPVEGTVALAWSVQSREMVFAYYLEVIRQMKLLSPESNPDELSRRPHNAAVWRLFDTLKTKQQVRKMTHKH